MPLYHTGLLIIRAWVDKASSKPLRAHIRATTDVSKGFEGEVTLADASSTMAAVGNWLGLVLEDGDVNISKENQSMTTWELKDLEGLPVISLSTALAVGRVIEVLFDPSANALFGLVVEPVPNAGAMLLVPLRGIRSIGKDAITVESLDVAEPFPDNLRALEISAADGYRSGMKVITESGELIGRIDKVTLNEDGTVASYHSSSGLFGSKHNIEPTEVRSGSDDMLIISDDAREGAVKNVTT
jgi:uncharacterized protein YrrD